MDYVGRATGANRKEQKMKSMQIKALAAIYKQMNECDRMYKQYEHADREMSAALESLWMCEEDKCRGMKDLYKILFGEKCPYTRSEIRELIETI